MVSDTICNTLRDEVPDAVGDKAEARVSGRSPSSPRQGRPFGTAARKTEFGSEAHALDAREAVEQK